MGPWDSIWRYNVTRLLTHVHIYTHRNQHRGGMMLAAGRKAASPTRNRGSTGGCANAAAGAAAEEGDREDEEGGVAGTASLAHPLAEGGAASL